MERKRSTVIQEEQRFFGEDADRIETLVKRGYLKELTEYPHWCVWRSEWRGGTRTKPPFNPHTGSYADVSDRKTWGTFGQALDLYRQGMYNGLSFVTSDDDPYIFLDVDHTVGNNQTVFYPGKGYMEKVFTAWEFSPNDGIRGIGIGTCDITKLNHHGQYIEIYSRNKALTLTFRHVKGTPATINDVTEACKAILGGKKTHRQYHLSLDRKTV